MIFSVLEVDPHDFIDPLVNQLEAAMPYVMALIFVVMVVVWLIDWIVRRLRSADESADVYNWDPKDPR